MENLFQAFPYGTLSIYTVIDSFFEFIPQFLYIFSTEMYRSALGLVIS
jgi:hypothetical protein